MGAKNHAVIMPDGKTKFIDILCPRQLNLEANANLVLNSIIGAAFGGNRTIDLSIKEAYALGSCGSTLHGHICW
jgi:hypothetical protein